MPKASVSWIVLSSLLLALSAHAQTPARAQDSPAQSCLEAAKKALGPDAEILKCGHLTGTDALEVVGAIRLTQFRATADGVPVSKLIVLQQQESRWVTELTADENAIRNPAGYIGVDFIDDSDKFSRYRVSFYDKDSHQVPGFTLAVFYLSPDGHNEGIPVEISWNPSVERFQEYTENHAPPGFQPENKNPPHIRTRKPVP